MILCIPGFVLSGFPEVSHRVPAGDGVVQIPDRQAGLSEEEKIEELIAAVEDMDGAVFIRNRALYTPREAAQHMRRKLGQAGNRVETAEDFIELCATQSSVTGRKYLIRFADGRTVESGTYMKDLLADL